MDLHDQKQLFSVMIMTESERESLTEQPNGCLVFCLDTHKLWVYDGSDWIAIGH